MSELSHPSALNLYQRYKQAADLVKNTSRATSSAWYQEALDLKYQVHIRLDGESTVVYFYESLFNEWSEGPKVHEKTFSSAEQAELFGLQILEWVRSLNGKSVGVILHVADEFSTAELDPSLDHAGALAEIREKAIDFPGEILEDTSISPDQASWRVVPYPADKSDVIGTTVRISRRLELFTNVLRNLSREQNFPIIVHSLSSPLVILESLPTVADVKKGRPFITILQYPWFTALAFFSEHAELRLLRTLQHRGQNRPANFLHSLTTTNASLELEDPDLYVVSLGQNADSDLYRDLTENFRESTVQLLTFETGGSIPTWMPEPLICQRADEGKQEDLGLTFTVLKKEKWFSQDFLPAKKEEKELYPSRNELRMLYFFKLGWVALLLLALVSLAWLALGIFGDMTSEEWAFSQSRADLIKEKAQILSVEKQEINYWDSLLEDRSKGWAVLEALPRLFPSDSGIIINDFQYLIRPESTPGQSRIGFTKEWKINGFAERKSEAYLNSLNSREGIASEFDRIFQATGNSSFNPAPLSRTFSINVKTQENVRFKGANAGSRAEEFPFTFEMTISQRFDPSDNLALTPTKAP